eukprot:2954765-Rhodomonas_salina.7
MSVQDIAWQIRSSKASLTPRNQTQQNMFQVQSALRIWFLVCDFGGKYKAVAPPSGQLASRRTSPRRT